jgi:hypothetical protein
MWFDVQQALAEIEGGTPRPLVQQLRDSTSIAAPCVAVVASVATPPVKEPDTANRPAEQHLHSTTFDGRPLTWTGRVVSLAAWRDLTEWERHGPNGRHWCGITKQWIETRKVEL